MAQRLCEVEPLVPRKGGLSAVGGGCGLKRAAAARKAVPLPEDNIARLLSDTRNVVDPARELDEIDNDIAVMRSEWGR